MALEKSNYYYDNGFVFQKNNSLIQNDDIITVNYLLSPRCQLDCVYCIARDVIKNYSIPTKKQVDSAIATIFKINPFVTVLTGGEPLLSPYLKYAVEKLYGKTNIIVDTNGLLLNDLDLTFFEQHGVLFRISMDSPIDANEITRICPFKKGISIIHKGLENMYLLDYPFVVSTVISNYNINQLESMLSALYLHSLSIGWRLQNIIPCHGMDYSAYTNDALTNEPVDFRKVKEKLVAKLKYLNAIAPNPNFYMQISDSNLNQSTILIMPDGTLTISNNSSNTRETVNYPELRKVMNRNNHTDRYILNKNL